MNRPRLEPSSIKQDAAGLGLLTMYERAADFLFQHYELTHGAVGEHDHHCEPSSCSCGWTAAEWAIKRWEEAKVAAEKA